MSDVEVYLTGEICHLAAPALRRTLDDAVASARHAVVVDLAGVSLLGAAGLTELARASVALEQDGRALRLRGPVGLVRRVIDIAGFSALLDEKALAPSH